MTPSIVFETLLPLIQGFVLCGGLIVAIGPQNLFVLRQGLRREHLFLTALVCTLGDVVLISIGVGGVGSLLAAGGPLLRAATICGALFLLFYAGKSFWSAWRCCKVQQSEQGGGVPTTLKATLMATLAFSLLNPTAYLDTIVMVGARSGQFQADQRLLFAVGAICASGIWFFSLAYGASRLAPLLSTPRAWRRLDLVSGSIMMGIAGLMLMGQTTV